MCVCCETVSVCVNIVNVCVRAGSHGGDSLHSAQGPSPTPKTQKHAAPCTHSPRDKRVSEATFLISSTSDWHRVTSILMLSVACREGPCTV